jgi:hypothetical protein
MNTHTHEYVHYERHVLCIMGAGDGYNDKYSITCYCVDESKPYCIIYKSLSILIIMILIIITVFENEK